MNSIYFNGKHYNNECVPKVVSCILESSRSVYQKMQKKGVGFVFATLCFAICDYTIAMDHQLVPWLGICRWIVYCLTLSAIVILTES